MTQASRGANASLWRRRFDQIAVATSVTWKGTDLVSNVVKTGALPNTPGPVS